MWTEIQAFRLGSASLTAALLGCLLEGCGMLVKEMLKGVTQIFEHMPAISNLEGH
jgi:hypothetical protein